MLNNDDIYTYYTDNEMNFGHQSLIFGLRELNSTETKTFCRNQSHQFSPIPDRPIHFTTDYSLRTYTSGCYYLDSMNNWRSDGLLVCFYRIFSTFILWHSLNFLFRLDPKQIIIKLNVFPRICQYLAVLMIRYPLL